MQCDMCGSDEAEIFKAEVEGVELNVCSKCSKFGKILKRAVSPQRKKEENTRPILQKNDEEVIQIITSEYSSLIKDARERLGLKQEEMAKRIKEKESLINKIESGKTRPDLNLARKIERFLKIRLITQHIEKHKKIQAGASKALTIGDILNIKD